MRQVRGILFLDYVRMLRRSGSERLARYLIPQDLELLHQHVDLGAWYPMETFERFGLAILGEVVGGEVDAIRLWGRGQIPAILSFFPELRAENDPRETLVRFANLLGSLFDYPAVRLESAFDGGAAVRVAYGMGPKAEEAASWQTCGFFEALAEAAGGAKVRGIFTRMSWLTPEEPTRLELSWVQPASRPTPQAPRPRVLLVDDEPLVRAGLMRVLRTRAEVTAAASAAEALQKLEAGPFDLVIADLDLGPGPDGLALLEEVARRWPEPGRVLHTGDAPSIARQALARGELHAIAEKPISLSELERLVLSVRGR